MTNSIKSLVVSFAFVAASLSVVACVGGPEDNNEPQAVAAAGTGGSSGSAGTGGSGGSNADPCSKLTCEVGECKVNASGKAECTDPCDAVSCKSNETCEIVNKKAKCVDNGTGGSAGTGGSGGSSGSSGSAGTGGSGGSSDPCLGKTCGTGQVCKPDASGNALCVDEGQQVLDIVPKTGSKAYTWDTDGEISPDANGEIHHKITVDDKGFFLVTVDYNPNCVVGQTASTSGWFKLLKVNGQDKLTVAKCEKDPFSAGNKFKVWIQ